MHTVVREVRFERELHRLQPNLRRADEFVEGAEWVLARDPKTGYQVREGSPVWCLCINRELSLHPAVIYYTFDESHVYFLSIQVVTRNGKQ